MAGRLGRRSIDKGEREMPLYAVVNPEDGSAVYVPRENQRQLALRLLHACLDAAKDLKSDPDRESLGRLKQSVEVACEPVPSVSREFRELRNSRPEPEDYPDLLIALLQEAQEALGNRSDECFAQLFSDCSHGYQITLGPLQDIEKSTSPAA